ncbi:hypothetical protein [Macrococcus sp. DPC7161]|uniref:hypothetical protein n=1 Tax=Macrococcus sp. DPC7161 TaxID=2507060 RepID=UPI00100B7EC1|nr:hypothetical protein [Macrococcus sp. DPC7161]RXK19056.1 hypothetical protein ER639_01715 [Macrococcus sp. DPC7161]
MITKEQLISVANELVPQILMSKADVKFEINSDYGTGDAGIMLWHYHEGYSTEEHPVPAKYKSLYEFHDDADLIEFLQQVENVLQGGLFNG